jgi:ankyrin repeat protein
LEGNFIRSINHFFPVLFLKLVSMSIVKQTVSSLIESGVDLSTPHRINGSTAIHFAAQSGRVELVERLLAAGCSVNEKNGEALTPLYWAVSGYDKLQQSEECISYAKEHTLEMVHCLLRHGVEFDRISLQRAIVNGHVEVVELLIRSGCPIEFETTGYHRVWSALHDAVRLHSLTILDLLCRLGTCFVPI